MSNRHNANKLERDGSVSFTTTDYRPGTVITVTLKAEHGSTHRRHTRIGACFWSLISAEREKAGVVFGVWNPLKSCSWRARARWVTAVAFPPGPPAPQGWGAARPPARPSHPHRPRGARPERGEAVGFSWEGGGW